MLITFFFTFSIVLIRGIIFDLWDMQGDRIIGRETLPIIVGEDRARYIVAGCGALSGLVLILSLSLHWISPLGWLFFLSIIYIFLYLYFYKKRVFARRLASEAIVDGNFLFLGFMAFVWNSVLANHFYLY